VSFGIARRSNWAMQVGGVKENIRQKCRSKIGKVYQTKDELLEF